LIGRGVRARLTLSTAFIVKHVPSGRHPTLDFKAYDRGRTKWLAETLDFVKERDDMLSSTRHAFMMRRQQDSRPPLRG
jgi:hypothetical protein